jgi:hypothetical protein
VGASQGDGVQGVRGTDRQGRVTLSQYLLLRRTMTVVADNKNQWPGPDVPIVEGRPDFANTRFGVTRAKKHPAYVFSTTVNSSLIHKIAHVDLHWYEVVHNGHALARRKEPFMIAHTVCGQTKFLNRQRSKTCEIPAPDAILCGRCHGEPATFGPDGAGTKAGITRHTGFLKLGCAVQGE